MGNLYLRKYGEAATIDFPLYETDGASLKVDATFASGDVKIMKDEGAEANTSNLPTDEGQGYSLALTATEMQAARIVIYVVDQTSPAVWIDEALVIETYGNASGQHAFDLDTATVTLSSSERNSIADVSLGRGVSNVEDTADTHSLAALILAALESARVGTTWTIRKTGGSTFDTKTLTEDASANPITGVT